MLGCRKSTWFLHSSLQAAGSCSRRGMHILFEKESPPPSHLGTFGHLFELDPTTIIQGGNACNFIIEHLFLLHFGEKNDLEINIRGLELV